MQIVSMNPRWVSSLMCGITCQSPEKLHFPLTALGFKKSSWIFCSDCLFHNGVKVSIMHISGFSSENGDTTACSNEMYRILR